MNIKLWIALLWLAPVTAIAKTPTYPIDCGRTPGFKVLSEIIPYTERTKVTQVNVTFIGKMPSKAQAKAALQDCLNAAMKMDASKDILPTAWIRKDAYANESDDSMLSPYGSLKYMAYTAATKKVSVEELKFK